MTLKELRIKHNISQKNAAKELKITPEYLSMIERGERNPSDGLKEKMSKMYRKSINDIFLAIKETKCLKQNQ